MATCLELASKKGGFVTLFAFSLHSNVDISVKWIGIVMKVVLFLKLIKGAIPPVNMRSIAFQMGAGCILEWRLVRVVEGGEAEGGSGTHKLYGKIAFRARFAC